MKCPACMTPLVTDCIDTVVLFGCPSCQGTLVPQRGLARVVDVLTREIPDLADRPLQDVPHHHQPRTCPRCDHTMESFGYMGTKFVILDRCRQDDLVWTDVHELEMMARMAAHNGARQISQHTRNMENLERMRPQVGASKIDYELYQEPAVIGRIKDSLSPTEQRVFGAIISVIASSSD